VAEQDVALLNARGIAGRHAETKINNRFEFAAGTSGEGGGVHAHLFGDGDGVKDVGRIAAGGDGNGDVAGAAEGFDLAGEDAAKAVVITDGGDGGDIGGERKCGESGAIEGEAADEFGGDVLGVRGAAAIAEEQDLVAALESMDQGSGELGEGGKDLMVAEEGTFSGDGGDDGATGATFEL